MAHKQYPHTYSLQSDFDRTKAYIKISYFHISQDWNNKDVLPISRC